MKKIFVFKMICILSLFTWSAGANAQSFGPDLGLMNAIVTADNANFLGLSFSGGSYVTNFFNAHGSNINDQVLTWAHYDYKETNQKLDIKKDVDRAC